MAFTGCKSAGIEFMNTKQKIELIESLLDIYGQLQAQFDIFTKLTGGSYDSPLANPVWQMFDKYLDAVADKVGDEDYWIAWFIWENELGKKAHKCFSGGKTHIVKTVKDLVKLIES